MVSVTAIPEPNASQLSWHVVVSGCAPMTLSSSRGRHGRVTREVRAG